MLCMFPADVKPYWLCRHPRHPCLDLALMQCPLASSFECNSVASFAVASMCIMLHLYSDLGRSMMVHCAHSSRGRQLD